MNASERARSFGRWLSSRPSLWYLFTGWIVFVLGSYPGYMSFDSTMQLFDVRNGVYTDGHAPVMTATWSLLEYIAAGPFPMLALQSGLFLFGVAAILRTQLSDRAAAVTAAAVLLFPPVFAPMAVIWRDSLMTAALLGAAGALLQPSWRWRVAAGVLLVIACSCRHGAVLAIIPLGLLATRDIVWWKRAGIAVAIAVGCAGVARIADKILVDKQTYVAQQSLQMLDLVGTLRRARVTNPQDARQALSGLRIAADDRLTKGLSFRGYTHDGWTITHGDNRLVEPVDTESESAALERNWRAAIRKYPRAYWSHRYGMTKQMIGLGNYAWMPIYDGFGEPDLMAPLHHRATTSDWQVGMQTFVRLFENTPLFKAWLYLVLAVLLLFVVRRRPLLVILLASGLAYFVALIFLATSPEYRATHWVIAATSIALAARLVHLRPQWQRQRV